MEKLFYALLTGFTLGLPAGMYCWYRWGTTLRSVAQAVQTDVTAFKGKK